MKKETKETLISVAAIVLFITGFAAFILSFWAGSAADACRGIALMSTMVFISMAYLTDPLASQHMQPVQRQQE
jgi:hypothetical protein